MSHVNMWTKNKVFIASGVTIIAVIVGVAIIIFSSDGFNDTTGYVRFSDVLQNTVIKKKFYPDTHVTQWILFFGYDTNDEYKAICDQVMMLYDQRDVQNKSTAFITTQPSQRDIHMLMNEFSQEAIRKGTFVVSMKKIDGDIYYRILQDSFGFHDFNVAFKILKKVIENEKN